VTKNEFSIEDPLLGVQVANSAKLDRKVEMFQWKAYVGGKDKLGQLITAYHKVWSPVQIGSAKNPIGYANPQVFPLQNESFDSRSVSLG
jgi:hypothetical protein